MMVRIRLLWTALLAGAGLCILVAVGAPAQEGDDGDGLPPQIANGLLTDVAILDDQLRRNYSLRRTVPFKDPSLALRFCGHNDWDWVTAETKVKASPDHLVPLGSLHTPNWESDKASLHVGYTLVQREIHLEDWISVYSLKNGFRLFRMHSGTLYDKPVAEALLEREENKERIISRLTVLRDGARLLVLEGRAALNGFPKHAATFALAAGSLRFEEPAPILGSETTETVVLSTPFRLTLRRPGSWKAEVEVNEPLGCQNLHLYNLGAGGILGGYVTVRAFERERFPTATPKALLQEFLNQLSDQGVRLKRFPTKGLPDIDPKAFDRERVTGGFIREDSGTPIEAYATAVSSARLVVLIAVVTPGLSASEGLWLSNRQAFRMAIESLKAE